ncbi:MAG TPA: protein-tyrosine-phosphatase [Roseiarcus sp.]|nr:protein-tyrosine-phosphatase [Roseiarcus sp.]
MKPLAFSALTVCGIDELDGHAALGVTHVLSILDPDWPEPEAFQAFDPHFRATFRFNDAIEPEPRIVLPARADVEAILAFGREAGDVSHLLIHCHAGISRSTAAMLMILAQAHPRESEDAIVDRLLRIRPQAWPNSRMIAFADELLGRDGRLTAAVGRIYARRLEAQPEFAELMRRGNRGREVEMGLLARTG